MCGAGKKIGSGTGVAHAAAGDAFSAAVHSLLFRLALEQSGTAMLHEPGDETGASAVAVSHVLRALALEQSGTATLHEPGDVTGASAVAVHLLLRALALEQSGTAMLHEPGDDTGASAVAVSHVLRALALEQSGTATLHEPGDETGASAVAVSHVLSALALEQSATAMLHEPGDDTGGSAGSVLYRLSALAQEQSGTATLHEPGDEIPVDPRTLARWAASAEAYAANLAEWASAAEQASSRSRNEELAPAVAISAEAMCACLEEHLVVAKELLHLSARSPVPLYVGYTKAEKLLRRLLGLDYETGVKRKRHHAADIDPDKDADGVPHCSSAVQPVDSYSDFVGGVVASVFRFPITSNDFAPDGLLNFTKHPSGRSVLFRTPRVFGHETTGAHFALDKIRSGECCNQHLQDAHGGGGGSAPLDMEHAASLCAAEYRARLAAGENPADPVMLLLRRRSFGVIHTLSLYAITSAPTQAMPHLRPHLSVVRDMSWELLPGAKSFSHFEAQRLSGAALAPGASGRDFGGGARGDSDTVTALRVRDERAAKRARREL